LTATARKLNITEDMLKPRTGGTGNWDEVVVPNNYRLRCVSVEDYEPKGEKQGGWIIHHAIDTSTGQCIFNTWLSFALAARWKIIEVFGAHGIDLREVGVQKADPNDLVGTDCGGFVDFPRDTSGQPVPGTNGKLYRTVFQFFPLVEMEEEEAADEAPFVEPEAVDTEPEEPDVL
jgi:hypothetical protein